MANYKNRDIEQKANTKTHANQLSNPTEHLETLSAGKTLCGGTTVFYTITLNCHL